MQQSGITQIKGTAMQGGKDPDCRRGMYWDEKYQNKEMFVWYQKLIHLRKKHTCICEGETVFFAVNDENKTLEITKTDREEKVTMIFNCSDHCVEIKKYAGMENLLSEALFSGKLEPYEAAVIDG